MVCRAGFLLASHRLVSWLATLLCLGSVVAAADSADLAMGHAATCQHAAVGLPGTAACE